MKITIHDNGGKTADRYTVIIGESMFTMSTHANMPNAVNMYAGQVEDLIPCTDPVVNIETLDAGTRAAIRARLDKSELIRCRHP